VKALGLVCFVFGIVVCLAGLFINIAYLTEYFAYVGPFIMGGLLLILTGALLHYRTIRHFISQRSTRYGVSAACFLVLITGLLGAVNYFSIHHNKRVDLTAEGLYSLSPLTLTMLHGLEEPVTITAFTGLGYPEKDRLKDLLEAYQLASDKLAIRYVDPDRNPILVRKYQVKSYGITVFEQGSNLVKIRGVQEQDFTNAIMKVSRKQEKTIYFLTGHGEGTVEGKERSDFSAAAQALRGMGHLVEDLELFRTGIIPSDCSLLIVPSPSLSLDARELEEVHRYLERGGSAFIMVDPGDSPELKEFLLLWRVAIGDNLVFDASSKLYGADFSKVVTSDYSVGHPVTKKFKLPTLFPGVRTVMPAEEGRNNLKVLPLVWSSQQSWAETNLDENKLPRYDEGTDKKGPLSLAVALSPFDRENRKDLKEGARMVVVGDSSFLTNAFLRSFGNLDFYLNVINWLVQEEHLISIQPQMVKTGFELDIRMWQLSFYPTIMLIFLVTIVTGGIVWWKRKRL